MIHKYTIITHNLGSILTYKFKDIVKLYKKFSPDFITLNEVQESLFNKKFVNQSSEITRLMNFKYLYFKQSFDSKQHPEHHTFQKLPKNKIAKQGNAIISNYEILEKRWIDLQFSQTEITNRETEPRPALICKIYLGNNNYLWLITTHLSNQWKEAKSWAKRQENSKIRQFQIKKLLAALEPLSGPVILTGDFNCEPNTQEIELIKNSGFIDATKNLLATRPRYDEKGNFILAQKYDYIFLKRGVQVDEVNLITTAGSKGFSDHNALCVSFHW